jgi:hypothetical protein
MKLYGVFQISFQYAIAAILACQFRNLRLQILAPLIQRQSPLMTAFKLDGVGLHGYPG